MESVCDHEKTRNFSGSPSAPWEKLNFKFLEGFKFQDREQIFLGWNGSDSDSLILILLWLFMPVKFFPSLLDELTACLGKRRNVSLRFPLLWKLAWPCTDSGGWTQHDLVHCTRAYAWTCAQFASMRNTLSIVLIRDCCFSFNHNNIDFDKKIWKILDPLKTVCPKVQHNIWCLRQTIGR